MTPFLPPASKSLQNDQQSLISVGIQEILQ
jgi:hypothetical protein